VNALRMSRLDGYNRATRSWACKECHTVTSIQRQACGYCGHREFHYFGSGREAKRYGELLFLVAARAARDLTVHPRFPLSVPMHDSHLIAEIGSYEADFSYVEAGTEQFVVEDCKPRDPKAMDPLARWKIRHFESEYGIKVRLVQ